MRMNRRSRKTTRRDAEWPTSSVIDGVPARRRLPNQVGLPRERRRARAHRRRQPYRPALGVPFDAFARRRIHVAMLDALHGLDWVPRSVRSCSATWTTRSAGPALARTRARGVEIATALGVSIEEYDQILDETRSADPPSSAAPAAARTAASSVAIAPEGGPRATERREKLAQLAQALGQIPDREKHILLYYEQELTLAEISRVIGVGESRVSQLRTQAIARLPDDAGMVETLETMRHRPSGASRRSDRTAPPFSNYEAGQPVDPRSVIELKVGQVAPITTVQQWGFGVGERRANRY